MIEKKNRRITAETAILYLAKAKGSRKRVEKTEEYLERAPLCQRKKPHKPAWL